MANGTGFGAGLAAGLERSGGADPASSASSLMGSQANLMNATLEMKKLANLIDGQTEAGKFADKVLDNLEANIDSYINADGSLNLKELSKMVLTSGRDLPPEYFKEGFTTLAQAFKGHNEFITGINKAQEGVYKSYLQSVVRQGAEEAKAAGDTGLIGTGTQIALQGLAGQGAIGQEKTPAGFSAELALEEMKQTAGSKPLNINLNVPRPIEPGVRADLQRDLITGFNTLDLLEAMDDDFAIENFQTPAKVKAWVEKQMSKTFYSGETPALDKITDFNQMAFQVYLPFQKEITGVAVREQEIPRMAKASINPEVDSPAEIRRKLPRMLELYRRVMARKYLIMSGGLPTDPIQWPDLDDPLYDHVANTTMKEYVQGQKRLQRASAGASAPLSEPEERVKEETKSEDYVISEGFSPEEVKEFLQYLDLDDLRNMGVVQ